MENLKIQCSHCAKIMLISRDVLLPYSGKNIKINCQNPECKKPQKLAVPEFKKTEPASNKTVIESNKTVIETKIEQSDKNDSHKKAVLNVLRNTKTEAQSFQLDNGLFTVGRFVNKPGTYVPDIAIRTNDTFISKKHCQITVVMNNKGGKDYILRDAGSTNGTFYNNANKALEKSDEVYLNHSDTIILGDTHIIFELK